MNRLTKELLRKFQMRDRNEITCCGVSVSQCYTLDLLAGDGEMSMVQLARKMFLDKSTMTRVVDGLIEREERGTYKIATKGLMQLESQTLKVPEKGGATQ